MKLRAGFLSLFTLMLGAGILLCYCVGTGLYWRYAASVPPVLYILLATQMMVKFSIELH